MKFTNVEIMKKLKYFKFLILLPFIKYSCSEEVKNNQYRVISLGNTGVFIKSDKEGILIDGLFNNGFGKYDVPSSSTLKKIINSKPPFDKTDIIIFTHNHPDHFNSNLVKCFLTNHKDSKILAPSSVMQALNKKSDLNNVMVYTDSSKKICINAYKIPHANDPGEEIEHFIFLLNIDGFKVLHLGDANDQDIEKLKGLMIIDTIDVVIAPRWFVTPPNPSGINLLQKYFNPKNVIISHITRQEYNEYREYIKQYKFANIYILEKPLTSLGFDKNAK
jgi:L-ascorbate metabolism protein UlaG (beta-lactamase superfamily)